MAHVETSPDALVIQLQGLRRTFGRWHSLVVPWTHVHRVHADERIGRSFPGARWGVSSYIPGVLTLGTFRQGGRRDFWDVRDPRNTIVVELSGEKYDRLVLEVADPEATVAAISTAARLSARETS